MDKQFSRYYNQELGHVRKTASDFAKKFPNIADRLGMSGRDNLEVSDPYIERLIESFAFLTARVQLKLDAQFPQFTQYLLEVLYPSFQAQTPATLVVQFAPDEAEAGLKDGYVLPRHSVIKSRVNAGDNQVCRFRTAHELTLWPLQLSSATYIPSASKIENDGWGSQTMQAKAGIKISLAALAGLALNEVKADDLPVYITGSDDFPFKLYEHIFANCRGFLIRAKGDKSTAPTFVAKEGIKPLGFDDQQALLPTTGRNANGYRLLQEYFMFPQRFLFFSLSQLQTFLPHCHSTEFEVLILLGQSQQDFSKQLDKDNFLLHCSPAINLIERRVDRITLSPLNHEYEVLADKTQPLNYEIYSILDVKGYSAANEERLQFTPLHGQSDHPLKQRKSKSNQATNFQSNNQQAFYVTRQEPRLLSQRQEKYGPRSSYVGGSTYISFADGDSSVVSGMADKVKQLDILALCTNRDLPLQMLKVKGVIDFTIDQGAPLKNIRGVSDVTRPLTALPAGESNWVLISLLSLNMQSLISSDALAASRQASNMRDAMQGQSAIALRELCRLMAKRGSGHIQQDMEQQISAIHSLETKPIVRQISVDGHIALVRGLRVSAFCDENGFEGVGAFLLGSVLSRFFSRYVAMNTFTEFELHSDQRGRIHRWQARAGDKHLI